MTQKESLKKLIGFISIITAICIFFSMIVYNSSEKTLSKVFAADESKTVILQIDSPIMTVNGEEIRIDENNTSPVIVSGRTLVPVRAIIEEMGGNVEWNNEIKEVTLTYQGDLIKLTIDSLTAYLNNNANTLDTAPAVINGRTMLPIRFVSESFGFDVDWNADTRTITIKSKGGINDASLATSDNTSEAVVSSNENTPVVYMTSEISPKALVNIYSKLGFKPEGKVAVKMSTGEPPSSNYLRPELIKDLVQSVDGTIVECNTAYNGSRAETEMHKQVIKDHGFTDIADVDIMDENGDMAIPVSNGQVLKENFVGKNLEKYDSMITLSHFKGHAMGGFGGAIKNMSIGIASREGKSWIHTGGVTKDSPWGGNQDKFLESMAEATDSVIDYMDGKIVYINVMNRISIDCDCNGNPAEPDMHDVGILASTDPVALDQACIDIVYSAPREESGTLIARIEDRNGLHTLEHAEKIGLGSRKYNLVNIDE